MTRPHICTFARHPTAFIPCTTRWEFLTKEDHQLACGTNRFFWPPRITSEIFVNSPRRVGQGDAVPESEAGTRANPQFIAGRQRDGQSGRDQRALARSQEYRSRSAAIGSMPAAPAVA